MSKFVALLLLGTSVYAVGEVFDGAPAVDQRARIENVAGEWRINDGMAMFNRAEHLFQVGQSFLSSGLAPGDTGTLTGDEFDFDQELENMIRAEELLQGSLSLRPGSAHSWTALAWVYSSNGNDVGMMQALENSWKFGPNNAQLSIDRLWLVETIASFADDTMRERLLGDYAAAISNDLAVARTFRSREVRELLEISEFLSEHQAEFEPATGSQS